VANGRGGGRAARWRQRADAGRGGGRTGGGPSFLLLAARSPSLPAFCRGRDRQRSPSPSRSVVVAERRAAAQGQRGGGAETRRRTGAAGRTGKVRHERQQQETAIGVSYGRAWTSHDCLDPSAPTGPDSAVGSQKPPSPQHSSPPARLRKSPSPHPFPAPLRAATLGNEDLASTPVGSGVAGSARGSSRGPGSSPVPAVDSPGATAQARRGCIPGHDCGVGEAAAIVLRVSTLQSQRAAAVAAAAAAR
jgi:hypothetical protein